VPDLVCLRRREGARRLPWTCNMLGRVVALTHVRVCVCVERCMMCVCVCGEMHDVLCACVCVERCMMCCVRVSVWRDA